MQAVILAGGMGTRLLPFTKVFPKPLVPLGDGPILDLIIRQLKHFGFTRITLAVGYMADMIRFYVRNGERYGIEIDYAFEDEPLGTVGPLAQIRGLENRFLVMNGDIVTNLDYRKLIKFHDDHKATATISTFQKTVKIDLGIIEREGDHMIVDYIEKPVYTFSVSMGVYIFASEVLHFIPEKKYLDLPTLIKYLIINGKRVAGYPFDGYWLDIGNYTDYEKALEEFNTIKGGLNLD